MGPEQQLNINDGLSFFEDLMAQAVAAPDDELAQAALLGHLQEVIDNGDTERIMAMGMIIGATACLHEHMETAASMFSEVLADHHDHGHQDAHNHDAKKTEEKKKKSKKDKNSEVAFSWLPRKSIKIKSDFWSAA